MDPETLSRIIVRELRTLVREIEAYPDDESPWATPAGVSNSAGTLALHLAGNLRHYIGAVLGGSGFVRDREGEFGRRGLTRAELRAEVEAAIEEVEPVLVNLDRAWLAEPFPQDVGGRSVRTGAFLVHLLSHLSYHLGQVDYHRRIVTEETGQVGAVSIGELSED